MIDDDMRRTAADLLALARKERCKMVTAESCTGGLIAALLTEIPGSSDVVERGFVTYSNEAKMDLLAVPLSTLTAYGAVSRQTALAMASGALANSRADIAVAVTGVAGPGGGTAEKPVGLVHLAACRRGDRLVHREMRYGDIGRAEVRAATVATALEMIGEMLKP